VIQCAPRRSYARIIRQDQGSVELGYKFDVAFGNEAALQ